MIENNEQMNQAMNKFYAAKVITLPELTAVMNRSPRSVQRYLQLWRCLTSYNHNGKYYTLPDIPDFNQFGIWRHRDIGFSRYGNLKETVRQLVENSTAGMTAAQLGEVLGVNPYSFISHFRDDPRLQREKRSGRLVYFCAKPEILVAQREERAVTDPPAALPTDAQAVIILVCLLKHPNAKIDELTREVQQKHSGIERGMIERLLDYHGIKKNLA
jgi:hypothetical protein